MFSSTICNAYMSLKRGCHPFFASWNFVNESKTHGRSGEKQTYVLTWIKQNQAGMWCNDISATKKVKTEKGQKCKSSRTRNENTFYNTQFLVLSKKKHQHNRFTHSKTLEKMQDQHKSSVYSGKNYDEF